jgi:hypothetical protein
MVQLKNARVTCTRRGESQGLEVLWCFCSSFVLHSGSESSTFLAKFWGKVGRFVELLSSVSAG